MGTIVPGSMATVLIPKPLFVRKEGVPYEPNLDY